MRVHSSIASSPALRLSMLLVCCRPDLTRADALTAPGSIEPDQAASILDPAQSAEPDEDTSPQLDPVPDYDAPDEDLATEGDNPPDSLLDEPIPREQQPGILRVCHCLGCHDIAIGPLCVHSCKQPSHWQVGFCKRFCRSTMHHWSRRCAC